MADGAIDVVGALAFAGIGLLIGSRAQTTETVSGLMNLVMLPMWVLSGIFFSSERFPEAAQPFIKALPLTPVAKVVLFPWGVNLRTNSFSSSDTKRLPVRSKARSTI